MNLIGKITPPTTKEHCFFIVARNYFTKWVEVVPMKSVSHADIIQFLKQHIIRRFGLLETITYDNGSVFSGGDVDRFASEYGIPITFSTSYYAQGNGQAESSNKVLKAILAEVIDDNPRSWVEMLSRVLWAFRTSQRSTTGITPYALTFGHDVVLPMEVIIQLARVARQHDLTPQRYAKAMLSELEDMDEKRLQALDHLHVQKLTIARAYNKKEEFIG
ncbi:uncharacterized protein LOC122665540 [Telopea speciosissima]|uniref:uncharacterized protein LOC122665540 n=1 Tax=Telopea speciosissima TaxID=54955 RepID=UPI001CC7D7A3|nr:uncharacterized protein LOC122665540 [Telopea speciosissima]